MLREFACVSVIALSLVACGKTPESERELSADRLIATADSFVDAFYSYDPDALQAALSSANDSIASILFYQGWAEGGNYEVVERNACKPAVEDKISCSIIVKDDLMGALGIDFNVTDTFHLTFSNGLIISVATSSNDPQEYYDAEEWVEKNRPELVDESCKRSKDGPSTPGDCVRVYVRGFSDFVEAGGLSDGLSIPE
jgi:hypothetical protein